MRIRVALIFAFMFLGGDLRAQQAPPAQDAQAPPRRPIAETVERLMRQPDFRLNVTVEQPVELWVKPLFIRPQDRLQPTPVGTYYHTEYLRMTTPEAFRSSTLYPMGMGVDPGEIANGFRRAWRSWQEDRIRKRVEQELADFLAAQDRAKAAAQDDAAR